MQQQAVDRAQLLWQQGAEFQRQSNERQELLLKEKISDLKSDKQRLEAELQSRVAAQQRLSDQRDSAQRQQERALWELENQLQQSRKATADLRADKDALQVQLRQLQEDGRQQVEQHQEVLRLHSSRQAALEERLEEEQQQHAQTQLLLEAAEQRAASGEAQVRQLKRSMQRAEQQAAEESARRVQAERDVEALRQQRSSLQAQLSEVRCLLPSRLGEGSIAVTTAQHAMGTACAAEDQQHCLTLTGPISTASCCS